MSDADRAFFNERMNALRGEVGRGLDDQGRFDQRSGRDLAQRVLRLVEFVFKPTDDPLEGRDLARLPGEQDLVVSDALVEDLLPLEGGNRRDRCARAGVDQLEAGECQGGTEDQRICG